jgi:GT2 family glycosyltransferase/glycosyltransferase involved in cell wall biosynthesis
LAHFYSAIDILGLEEALNRRTEKPQAPALTVCILNYNKPSFSILSAIAAATNVDQEVEVLILDNGSQPMDFAVIYKYCEKLGNVRAVRSQKNLFFGEGNNILVDMAAADKVLFLNNDAFVGPDTINDMLRYLDATPEAAGVGPTFLFPNLEIQEAGGTISNCGRQVQLHKHTSFWGHLRYMSKDPIEGVQYVSAACVCIRAEVLKDIGGFDYIYEPFYFEDTDFCKRMESLGYRLDYLPGSFVIHYENASTREFLSTGFMSQIEKNRMKFQERWLYTTKGFKPRSLISEVKTEALPGRKTAVIYTPFDISLGGGERYILSCALALSREYNVILCGNTMVSNTRISFVINDLGLKAPGVGSIRTSRFEDISDWEDIEVMIAMGNEIIPPVPFNAKVNIFHCQYPFPSHHSDRFEVTRLQNVDAFFVNSEFTRRKVDSEQRQLSFDIPVVVTGAPVRAPSRTEDDASREDDTLFRLVSVGRFEPLGHSKRQDITIKIFREFYNSYNDSSLSLIGSVGGIARREEYVADLRKSAKGLPVTFNLDASDTLLSSRLQNADVLIHSCGYGIDVRSSPERLEHFGIVILEAMANGVVPLVYRAGGPAEIIDRFGIGYTFETVSEAAAKLTLISELTREEREDLAVRAKEVAAHFFDEPFQKVILDSISQLVTRKTKM